MSITYLGHSCFEFTTEKDKIIIDPYLIKSPNYNPEGMTDIFVTHGHGDHLGSAIEISKRTGAKITAVYELANYCASQGAAVNAIGLGSWIDYSWGRAVAVPAFHSNTLPDGSYGGCPCGFVFDFGGIRAYHAGDTCLSAEMKVIRELYEPDSAMLPIGGYYTMDIEAAVKAAEYLGVTGVIPMHYNTFDNIKVDIGEFERQVREKGKVPVVLQIGQSLD